MSRFLHFEKKMYLDFLVWNTARKLRQKKLSEIEVFQQEKQNEERLSLGADGRWHLRYPNFSKDTSILPAREKIALVYAFLSDPVFHNTELQKWKELKSSRLNDLGYDEREEFEGEILGRYWNESMEYFQANEGLYWQGLISLLKNLRF